MVMPAKFICLILFLFLTFNYCHANSSCMEGYLILLGNYTKEIMRQNMYSGRFLNDLGEFENCTEHEFSRFMLSQIELNITGKKDMSFLNKDTARFVQGLCVPKECSDTDSKILRDSFFLQDINFTRDSTITYN